MRRESRILFVLFAILFTFAVSAEPPTHRADLSPLARALDAMLFGDGAGNVYPQDRNLFTPGRFKKEEMTKAIAEVKAFRGEEYEALQKKGSDVYAAFQDEVQDRAIERGKAAKIVFNPLRDVAYSWMAIDSGGSSGSQPLNSTEVANAALRLTEAEVPVAFQPGGLGLGDPDAEWAYPRNANRAEVFFSKPKPERMSREDFEAWRLKQITSLSGMVSKNIARILESDARRGNETFLWEADPSDPAGRRLPLSAEEIRASVLPLKVRREVSGNLVFYVADDRARLRSPDGRTILSAHWEVLNPSRRVTSKYNGGTLDKERAIEEHLAELLAISNRNLLQAIEKLNEFQYDHYKKDRGKAFFANWKILTSEALEKLNRKHDTPSSTASLEHLRELPKGFEISLWAKFEQDPGFWASPRIKKSTLWEVLNPPDQSLLSWLSSEPPTVRQRNIEKAKEAAWKAIKRYSFIPVVVAAVLGVESHFPFLPNTLSAFPYTPPVVQLEPKPEPQPPPKEPAPKRPSMPSGFSGVQSAFNKPLPTEDTTLYTIERTKENAKIPRRFSFGAPKDATVVLSVPAESPETQFIFQGNFPHEGPAEIPTGDGTRLSSLKVIGENGRVWKPDVDYELRTTEAGEVVIFPKTYERYEAFPGFTEKPADNRPIQHPALNAFNHERLEATAAKLSRHGFGYLPELIREMLRVSRETGRPLTLFDLEGVLSESAFYSQIPQNHAADLRDELGRAARFLNPEKISCYECDGAQELAVAFLEDTLPKEEGIEVRPRGVIGRKAGSMELTENGFHADVEVNDRNHEQRFVIDTTPGKFDPRDPQPPNGDQLGFVSGIRNRQTERERGPLERQGPPRAEPVHRAPKMANPNLAAGSGIASTELAREDADRPPAPSLPETLEETVQKEKPPEHLRAEQKETRIKASERKKAEATKTAKTEIPEPEKTSTETTSAEPSKAKEGPVMSNRDVPHRSPFSEAALKLFGAWSRARSERQVERPVAKLPVASGGIGPEPVHDANPTGKDAKPGEPTAIEPVKIIVVKPTEPPKEYRTVKDEKLDALHERISDAARGFAQMKLVPKRVEGGFASMPSGDLIQIGRLIERRLNGEIDTDTFEKDARRFVPEDFQFPIGTLNRKIQAFLTAARKQQLKILKMHREAFENRLTKDYPRLLDPQVEFEIIETFKWMASREWNEPYQEEIPALPAVSRGVCEDVARVTGG